MNKIVLKVHEYLEKVAKGEAELPKELLDEFGERCKAKLAKQFDEQKSEFRLRMSNVGRPLRQLMLEQQYGRSTPEPEFMLKMIFGDLYESLVLFLLKASEVEITEQDTKVSLPIKTAKGVTKLEGELDVGIKLKDEGIYDIKSASPWSYDNKFDYASLIKDDAFGYVDQLCAYAAASNKKAKGWIVVNKSDGRIKVCEIPEDVHDELMKKSKATIEAKVAYIVEEKPIPECSGVVDEKFFGKLTGNKILGPSCRFCSCKDKCHKELSYMPDVNSKAKEPKWVYYIGTVKKPNK